MAYKRRAFFCARCDGERYFRKSCIDHSFHRALCLATLGLWSPGWLGFIVRNAFRPWKCPGCGKAAMFIFLHLQAVADKALVMREIHREVRQESTGWASTRRSRGMTDREKTGLDPDGNRGTAESGTGTA